MVEVDISFTWVGFEKGEWYLEEYNEGWRASLLQCIKKKVDVKPKKNKKKTQLCGIWKKMKTEDVTIQHYCIIIFLHNMELEENLICHNCDVVLSSLNWNNVS